MLCRRRRRFGKCNGNCVPQERCHLICYLLIQFAFHIEFYHFSDIFSQNVKRHPRDFENLINFQQESRCNFLHPFQFSFWMRKLVAVYFGLYGKSFQLSIASIKLYVSWILDPGSWILDLRYLGSAKKLLFEIKTHTF